MTALSIAQACADIVGVKSPEFLVGSRDTHARTMLRLINREGKNLARKRSAWGGTWTELQREHVFFTVADQAEYPLPVDFIGLASDTLWDRTTYREMRGVLTPREWQSLRSGLIETVSLAPYYRLLPSSTDPRRRAFFIDPVPGGGEELVLEYMSANWAVGSNDQAKGAVDADSDDFVFDEDLIEQGLVWRFKQSRGLSYGAELAEYEIERDRRFGLSVGPRDITVGAGTSDYYHTIIPETGYGILT